MPKFRAPLSEDNHLGPLGKCVLSARIHIWRDQMRFDECLKDRLEYNSNPKTDQVSPKPVFDMYVYIYIYRYQKLDQNRMS